MKSFTTTQDMTQYEVSQDYCEPYLGATHDNLQAARFNKYDTHVDKNEFFVYDDVNHKYNIYRRVEYIENTSTAYIDIGFLLKGEYKTEINFIITNADGADGYCIFGARQSATNSSYSILYDRRDGYKLYCDYNSYEYSRTELIITPNNIINIVLDKDKTIINNTIVSHNQVNFTTPYNGRIFDFVNRPNPTTWKSTQMKLFYCRIYNENTLVRDFIPVKNTLTNQYGLLDTVEQKFYVSPNGVEFNGGNEIIEDKNGVQYYIKNYVNVSNNQRYTCTFNPRGNDSWEGKFHFNGTGRQDILGAWNSQGQQQFGFMGIDNNQMRFLYNTQTIYTSGYNIYGNKTFTLKTNKNKFYIYNADNTLMYQSSATYVSDNHPVRYFGIGHLEGSVYASDAKMYYFKYWRGDTLIFDFIPVQRISDNVYGLYDKITNIFYQSNGGTEFTGG